MSPRPLFEAGAVRHALGPARDGLRVPPPRAPWLAALAAAGALLVALASLRELPLFGALMGAGVAGCLAWLLAETPAASARAGFVAGAAAVALLLGARVFAGATSPLRPPVGSPEVVEVTQWLLAGMLPGPIAWGLARVGGPWRRDARTARATEPRHLPRPPPPPGGPLP